jgi:hypothetical protein
MRPLRADQTYDGRTYANPDEMLKIAKISCVSTDIRQTASRPGSHFSPAWTTAVRSPLPRAKGDRGLRLKYSDAETRSICLSVGIPLRYNILRYRMQKDKAFVRDRAPRVV